MISVHKEGHLEENLDEQQTILSEVIVVGGNDDGNKEIDARIIAIHKRWDKLRQRVLDGCTELEVAYDEAEKKADSSSGKDVEVK